MCGVDRHCQLCVVCPGGGVSQVCAQPLHRSVAAPQWGAGFAGRCRKLCVLMGSTKRVSV
jgi:hypothetical protein